MKQELSDDLFICHECDLLSHVGTLPGGFKAICPRCGSVLTRAHKNALDRMQHLVAFSCKRRGFCPSCGARRMVESAAHLVDHVFPEVPVRQFVLTFPFPLRFLLAANPKALTDVLGVVQRSISTFVIRQAGFTLASGAKTGAVTLIQRFGSALNLNPHLHMLFLNGAYRFGSRKARFHRARRATPDQLEQLLDTLSRRIVRVLERRGLLIADPVDPYLELELGSSLDQIQAASINYRIAIGPHAGRKAVTLYSVPPVEDEPSIPLLATMYGFSGNPTP